MTKTELTDNLVFIAAEQMLKQIAEKTLLTEEEAQLVLKELKRRLRPTIL